MQSYDRSDSYVDQLTDQYVIGEKDRQLSFRLQKAGPEHCKHLRMIMVWADIKADFSFWKQFDCYRAGVEKLSTSTMHKLMARPLTFDDFSRVEIGGKKYWPAELSIILGWLNERIKKYKTCDDEIEKKCIWQETVNLLPESYLQTRTVMMSYAAIRNIVRQRKGHKLGEWKQFIDWAYTLPYNCLIFDEEDDNENSESN